LTGFEVGGSWNGQELAAPSIVTVTVCLPAGATAIERGHQQEHGGRRDGRGSHPHCGIVHSAPA
jgi:hypothetical protein